MELEDKKNMDYIKYNDVKEILHSLTEGIVRILGEAVEGIYLTGSLSYGDFNPKSSDIDLLVVLNKPSSKDELEALELLHAMVEKNHSKWAKRIECSYVTRDMLQCIEPPKTPRPYLNEGIFYPEAPYGNEWTINQYLLYQHGISLMGPDFKTLVAPIGISDVREACIRDLFEEWEPKIQDSSYLKDAHYQSYVVLTLCRILYTAVCGSMASKKVSASWVKSEFGPRWNNLIQTAEDWRYGEKMNSQEETIVFIKFVVNKVKELQP